MANVLFKQGLQASLKAIRDNLCAIEGTFYLTTDTHRLYIGRITDTPRSQAAIAAKGGTATQDATHCDAVPVNEGVNYVATLGDLPTVTAENKSQYAGQFYYVSGSNILCVYSGAANGTNGGWVQINPNTNTKVEGFEYTVTTKDGVATIQGNVKNTTDTGVSGGDQYKDSYTMQGAGSVKVSSSGKAITITGDQYELAKEVQTEGGNSVTLKLNSTSGTDNSSVKIAAGSNVSIGTNSSGDVTISSKNTELDHVTIGNGDKKTNPTTTNGFYVEVGDTDQNNKTGKLDPLVAVGTDPSQSGNTVHFVNGTATLPVYSKDDIDEKLKGLNAMTFKGLVNDGSLPPTVDVQIGDTYKASGAFTFTNNGKTVSVNKGDLLIAKGVETSGVITSGLEYEIISSGDDTVTLISHDGESINHGIQLREYNGTNKGDIVSKFEVAAGTSITLTDTPGNLTGGGKSNKVTIGHANVTRAADTNETAVTQAVNTNLAITAVTGVTTNAQGHVTGVTKKTFNIKDTNGKVSAVNNDIATTVTKVPTSGGNSIDSYTATVKTGVRSLTSDGMLTGYEEGSYEFKSSSLQITSTAATIGADKKATKAATMTIDMVWGTF